MESRGILYLQVLPVSLMQYFGMIHDAYKIILKDLRDVMGDDDGSPVLSPSPNCTEHGRSGNIVKSGGRFVKDQDWRVSQLRTG